MERWKKKKRIFMVFNIRQNWLASEISQFFHGSIVPRKFSIFVGDSFRSYIHIWPHARTANEVEIMFEICG